MADQPETRRIAAALNSSVDGFFARYHGLDNSLSATRPAPGTWSPKEIIGHLIDSAANNHQRFIRLQMAGELVFPEYGKDNLKWVQLGHYNDMDFCDVILAWKQYNLVIARIIQEADPGCLLNRWKTDGKEVTLIEVIRNYLTHLNGHLASFEYTLRQLTG